MEQVRKVILFGRGMVFHRKVQALAEEYEIVLILDNSIPLGETEIDETTGVNVVNPKEINNYPVYPIVLLSYALGDMYYQLMSLDVDESRIIFGICKRPYNSFEKMIFGDGIGRIEVCGEDIMYVNDAHKLRIQSNPSDFEEIVDFIRETSLYPKSTELLNSMPLNPIDDTYGMKRGTPIDRYYINKFISKYRTSIRGTVMEIGDRRYTLRYGRDAVTESFVLQVDKEDPNDNIIRGDFSSGEGIQRESIDCLICTQTLPFIYDVKAAAENIMKLLKRKGVALITVAGISQIISYERIHFGHYWSFTDMSLKRLFEDMEDVDSVEVYTYGNVKTATAFLYGLSCEEVDDSTLEFCDSDYQVIIAAKVRKR